MADKFYIAASTLIAAGWLDANSRAEYEAVEAKVREQCGITGEPGAWVRDGESVTLHWEIPAAPVRKVRRAAKSAQRKTRRTARKTIEVIPGFSGTFK